jgi:hypothetical protein
MSKFDRRNDKVTKSIPRSVMVYDGLEKHSATGMQPPPRRSNIDVIVNNCLIIIF